jgi:ribosomal protein S11
MFREGHNIAYISKYFIESIGTKEEERQKINEELTKLLSKKNLSEDEILKLVKEKFGYKAEAAMREMLKSGQHIEEVIDQFIKDGFDERKETELEKKMKNLLKGKTLSPEEKMEFLKSQLGPESKEKLEELLKQGKSVDYIWRYFMKHGETAEQEEVDIGSKLQKILVKNSLTEEQIMKLMRKEFGSEIETAIRELFTRGYTVKEVVEFLSKLLSRSHMNKKELINLLNAKVREKCKSRSGSEGIYDKANVFLIIDVKEAKENIPYMHPTGKMQIFRTFFKKLHMFVVGKGLSQQDILDLIRSRLGGSYGTEFDSLRTNGGSLQEIVEYFLKKDEQMRQEARRRARLVGKAKIDQEYDLYRKALKERWGIIMHYTYSKECGLHLILNSVSPEGPAWACGARPGDVIKTVNYWKTYLMDQPHCAAHLFQAAGRNVRLGVMKTPVDDPDLGIVGIY